MGKVNHERTCPPVETRAKEFFLEQLGILVVKTTAHAHATAVEATSHAHAMRSSTTPGAATVPASAIPSATTVPAAVPVSTMPAVPRMIISAMISVVEREGHRPVVIRIVIWIGVINRIGIILRSPGVIIGRLRIRNHIYTGRRGRSRLNNGSGRLFWLWVLAVIWRGRLRGNGCGDPRTLIQHRVKNAVRNTLLF